MTFQWSWNTEALERVQVRDGMYTLATNRLDWEQYPSARALEEYKERNTVEQRIGDLKSRVKIRPLFVHTDERV